MRVKGTFAAFDGGHMGLFSGTLKHATLFEPPINSAECRRVKLR